MALNLIPTVLVAIMFSTVPSAVRSQICQSPNFAHCLHLHALDSQIQYTYNATNASLSFAFISTPPNPDGWTSWAINPTKTGMIGAQAFVAYTFNNSLRVKTLNIDSPTVFLHDNLTFPYWNVSAKKGSNGTITLFGSLAVPGNKTEVNQVWQVGPGTSLDGKLKPHNTTGESTQSKSVLRLTGEVSSPPAPAPAKSSGANFEVNLGFIRGCVVSFLMLCLV